jgi:hypothetical protein
MPGSDVTGQINWPLVFPGTDRSTGIAIGSASASVWYSAWSDRDQDQSAVAKAQEVAAHTARVPGFKRCLCFRTRGTHRWCCR